MPMRFLELIFFSTYAELRAERSRSYLGIAWWLIEPAMQMAVYYVVFALALKTQTPDFVPFLLIGLTAWQWFKSSISHGGMAIWQSLALIRQVRLPVALFPSVQVLADAIKFLFIFSILLIVLWCSGFGPNVTYVALLPILLVELLFASAIAYLVAAVVPLVPDLRFIIEQILIVAMFLSGVVFPLHDLPPGLQDLLALNPIVVLIDALRGILMYAQWPNWIAIGRVTLISLILYGVALFAIQHLAARYVKLAS